MDVVIQKFFPHRRRNMVGQHINHTAAAQVHSQLVFAQVLDSTCHRCFSSSSFRTAWSSRFSFLLRGPAPAVLNSSQILLSCSAARSFPVPGAWPVYSAADRKSVV